MAGGAAFSPVAAPARVWRRLAAAGRRRGARRGPPSADGRRTAWARAPTPRRARARSFSTDSAAAAGDDSFIRFMSAGPAGGACRRTLSALSDAGGSSTASSFSSLESLDGGGGGRGGGGGGCGGSGCGSTVVGGSGDSFLDFQCTPPSADGGVH